jgi:glycosyltransferase involved in cell wall biosynthesis
MVDDSMTIAICICTYKRASLLDRVLRSLSNIQMGELEPKNARIIVVDNYPDGQARSVCESVSQLLPVQLDFIEEKQRGASFARNRAIQEALDRQADFVAFIDDDDLPEPDWLYQLLEKQKETKADIVYGVFPPAVNPDWPGWLRKSPLFDQPKEKERTKYGAPRGVGTGNVLISKSILEGLRCDGPFFLSEFGVLGCEDADFFARAAKYGATFSLAEKSLINRRYEERRLTFVGLLKDAFRVGNCIRQLVGKHGTAVQVRRRKRKAFKRVSLGMLSAPSHLFARNVLVRNLYQICRELGVLWGHGGER